MQLIPQAAYAQHLFDNRAWQGTDSGVSAAIMETLSQLMPAPFNLPNGPELTPTSVEHKADTKTALNGVGALFAKQPAGAVALAMVGEDHHNDLDHARAMAFIGAVNGGSIVPNVVVYERGMNYPAPTTGVAVVREANLTTAQVGNFGLGLSARQRSMVVAGYLALISGGGNQQDISKFLIFFGANHQDILTYYKFFAQHSPCSYLAKAPTSLFYVRSFVASYAPESWGVRAYQGRFAY